MTLVATSYVIDSGQTVTVTDDIALQLDGGALNDPIVTIAGRLLLNYDQQGGVAWGIWNLDNQPTTGERIHIALGGEYIVTATAPGIAAQGVTNAAGDVINDGFLDVTSTWLANAVTGGGFNFSNTGTVEASAAGAGGVTFNTGGLDGGSFSNSGFISVAGGDYGGVGVYAGGQIQFDNSGVLRVTDTTSTYDSIAVSYSRLLPSLQTFTNSGTIEGDYAFKEQQAYSNTVLSPDVIRNTGTIHGLIDVGFGNDAIYNAGAISGAVYLKDGDDLYDGTGGSQVGAVYGGLGNDVLTGTSGADVLYGDEGSLFDVSGQDGNDTLNGGDGADHLFGEGGNDRLNGGAGDDILDGGAGNDVIDGGAGDDTAAFHGSQASYVITHNGAVTTVTGPDGTDTLINVEHLQFDGQALEYDLAVSLDVRGTYVIDAGRTFNATGPQGAFLDGGVTGPDPAFANYGTFNVTQTQDTPSVYGVGNGMSSFYATSYVHNGAGATFTVTATGASTAAFGYFSPSWSADVSNDGLFQISAVADAYGIVSSDNGFVLSNTGTFDVSGDWATGAYLSNGGTVHNSGDLIVTAQTGAATGVVTLGVSASSGLTLDNTGSIVASTSSPDYASVAVEIANASNVTITNSGLIQGDYAVAPFRFEDGSDNGHVDLLNSGTIRGVIDLGSFEQAGNYDDDVIHNTGQIVGTVSLGSGKDLYDGTGGSQVGAVHGDRGDDTLIGTAGDDQLFGDQGDDRITGGAGADFADGGDGYDVFVVSGARANYTVTDLGADVFSVTDNVGSDGVDHITGFEAIQFSDTLLPLGQATNTIVGTAGADTLTGTAGADVIYGLGGDDTLYGGGGNDVLYGGGGTNALYGGEGDDTLDGWGVSVCDGGPGNDTATYADAPMGLEVNLAAPLYFMPLTSIENLIGTVFNDTLTGDSGDNVLSGGAGDDTLDGALGNDTLDGGIGYNTASYASAPAGVTVSLALQGSAQNTVGAGVDTLLHIDALTGSDFNDVLTGDNKDNVITAGGGDDLLNGGAGDDTLNGGLGVNTVTYADAGSAITLDLSKQGGPQATGGSGADTLIAIQNVIGSVFGDTLTGDDRDNQIRGGAGNDVINGGGGIDTAVFSGVRSAYTISTIAGTTTVSGPDGADTLTHVEKLQFSDQTIDTPGGAQTITGTSGNDTLTAGAGDDFVYGLGGDDILDGGPGNDSLDGGDGIDTAYYGSASSGVTASLADHGYYQVTGGAGTDVLLNFENLTGSNFNDVLGGDENANVVSGGGGDDVLTGDLGDDTLDGGAGNDTASYLHASSGVTVSLAIAGPQDTGAAGTDTLISIENLFGSYFNDTLTGDNVNNVLTGGGGDDSLDGGGGIDTAVFAGDLSSYTLSTSAGLLTVTGPDGTSTLGNIEKLQFDDQTINAPAGGLTLTGTSGDDHLAGGSDGDLLTGLDGGDTLSGGAGKDTLQGGAGDDTLDGGAGDDALDGGTGTDTASYASAAAGVVVSLAAAGPQSTGGAGVDTLVSIENLIGSGFADTLTASNAGASLQGAGGDDVLVGGAGNDILDGGAGTDTASYEGASLGVTVSLAISGPQNTGGAGTDTLSSIEILIGSGFADTLTAASGGSQLQGFTGDDTLISGTGDDILDGGPGTDTAVFSGVRSSYTVTSGGGVLTVVGPDGTDTLIHVEKLQFADQTLDLGVQNQTLNGTPGNDVLTGGAGDDTLTGLGGDDTLDGGSGSDTASYAAAAAGVTVSLAVSGPQDTIGAGIDTLVSVENLIGSSFPDVLTAAPGGSLLQGGGGDDTLVGGAGNDTLDGGAGTDTASYAAATSGVTVNLQVSGIQNTGGGGVDTLISIEHLVGSDYADTLTAQGYGCALFGMGGDDVLVAAQGNDVLDGGSGTDTAVLAGHRADYVVLTSNGSVQAIGPLGTTYLYNIEKLQFDDQTIDAPVVNQSLNGGAGDDVLAGGSGADVLSGHGGDDTLDGGPGDDTLDGGPGNDTASYASAPSAVAVDLSVGGAQNTGGAGSDTLVSIENLTGSSFNDSLTGDGGANVIHAGDGGDTVTGGGGNDHLFGDGGDDVLVGGPGNDALDGGPGLDYASYAAATSAVAVDLGAGVASGGDGNDTLTAIENVFGSDFNDNLVGDGGRNIIHGGDGGDTIVGGAGDDVLYGEGGDDVLTPGSGDDIIDGGAGHNYVVYAEAPSAISIDLNISNSYQGTGGSGSDWLVNIQGIYATAFNDNIIGDNNRNDIHGGDGGDTISGGGGDDVLYGEGGDDVLIGGPGDDILNGGAGRNYTSYDSAPSAVAVDLRITDSYQGTGGAGSDWLINIQDIFGSQFNDNIIGDDNANSLWGSGGGDSLSGQGGDDNIVGGDGADTLTGGAGNDSFFYNALSDSTVANPDLITDFSAGDRIYLDAIDADTSTPGDQAFHIGSTPGHTSDLVISYNAGANTTTLWLYVDGDATPDGRITLSGDHSGLTTADLVL